MEKLVHIYQLPMKVEQVQQLMPMKIEQVQQLMSMKVE